MLKYRKYTYNLIIEIERGTGDSPTLKTMLKLADAFGVGIDDLIGRGKHWRNKK